MAVFLTEEEQKHLTDRRRDFHAHPELAYTENRTSRTVSDHLKKLGYQVQAGVAKTGVVGLLQGAGTGKTLMLRADMDCLPIQELNDVPYRSQTPGLMHACGHDAHTAILMTVAEKLMAARQDCNGNIKICFQPAEEGGNGAAQMVKEGVLENPHVDAAFGLHVWSNISTGKIALNPGALLAGVHSFEVTVRGKGGHGAAPHQTVDPIVTAAQTVIALQTVVSRNVDPLATAVVTIGSFHGGSAFNVIADSASFLGTVRYFDPKLGDRLPEWIERVVRGTTESMGATYELKYERLTPPTINDPAMAEFIREVSAKIVGSENVIMDVRTMGGEDMAFFLNAVPGCFFFVGAGNEEKKLTHPHHSPHFDIDEAALPIGVEILCRAAQEFLNR